MQCWGGEKHFNYTIITPQLKQRSVTFLGKSEQQLQEDKGYPRLLNQQQNQQAEPKISTLNPRSAYIRNPPNQDSQTACFPPDFAAGKHSNSHKATRQQWQLLTEANVSVIGITTCGNKRFQLVQLSSCVSWLALNSFYP